MQTEQHETTRLLQLASEGSMACWGELLTHHVGRLSRLIMLRLDQRVRHRIDAEDVIQEIYAEAWQHLPQYQRHADLPFYLWLRGLAQNKLRELHRRHLGTKMRDARREERDGQLADQDRVSATLSSIILDSGTSPSHAVVREETRIRLHKALSGMDCLDREVLVLRHLEQLSPAETAQVLEISEKAAGMRYVRAIRRLRETLASLPGGLSGFRL